MGAEHRIQDAGIQFSSPQPHGSLQEGSGVEGWRSTEMAQEQKDSIASAFRGILPALHCQEFSQFTGLEALARLNSGIRSTMSVQVNEIE